MAVHVFPGKLKPVTVIVPTAAVGGKKTADPFEVSGAIMRSKGDVVLARKKLVQGHRPFRFSQRAWTVVATSIETPPAAAAPRANTPASPISVAG